MPKKPKTKILEPNSNYILALDIGTQYAKALIAKKGRAVEIVGIGKAKQALGNIYAGAISDISGVVKTCEEALSQAEQMAGLVATQVIIGIAGELVKGNTATIKYRRQDPSKAITEAEMEGIIKKVQQRAEIRARRQIALETGNEEVDVRLINSALVNLFIDGYKVTNPLGFKGKDIAVQMYTAFAPLVHVSAIEKVCDELQLDLVAVAVEPFAVCRACLGDDADSNFTGVVMDVGSGTTDIAVVDDGGVEGTKMFNIGGGAFTRQIAEKLGLDFEDAEKLKLLESNPKMKPELRKKINDAINQTLPVWISGVQLALEEFKKVEALPTKILLCGGGVGLDQIPESLATLDWYKSLPFSRRPIIHIITIQDIPDTKNSTNIDLDHSFATAIGLLRVGMDTLVGTSTNNGIRAKLTKLLRS